MMISDIEDYFAKGCGRCDRFDTPDCSAQNWVQGLHELRRICLESGLEETVKWAHPCYMHAGRNIVVLGAFRGDYRMNFFNAALMIDREEILEKQGPNTQQPGMIRFTADAQALELEPVIRRYLQEAKEYAAAGIKPAKEERELEIPNELIDAMDADPELAEAFHGLTPGRQKSYVIGLNSAKQSTTRIRRIAKYRGRILAGKGANER